MHTLSTHRSAPAPWRQALGALALATGAWALSGAATTAQARDDIHWSIGVNSPGVSVGVSNAPTIVYGYPQYGYPVYQPRPVVVSPRPVVVYPAPVVVNRYPVYRVEGPYWRGDRRGPKWHHRHHRHGGWDD